MALAGAVVFVPLVTLGLGIFAIAFYNENHLWPEGMVELPVVGEVPWELLLDLSILIPGAVTGFWWLWLVNRLHRGVRYANA